MVAELSVVVVGTQLAAPVPGGTGRYTSDLLRTLAATRPSRARLEVFPAAGSVLPYRVLARLWDRGLPPRATEADVVHAPTLMFPPVGRATALIVTIHDVVPWTHPETLTPRGVAFHRGMAQRAARRADLVLTPTEAVAEQVRRFVAPAAPVRAVPPPVWPLVVPADAAASREAVGVEHPYLLFVGTAEPRKGLDVLVAAIREAGARVPDLVVVGPTGWGHVRVDDLAARAGVASRVHVLGRVDDATLAALYAGATAVAVPSLAEGFGLPLLEAMTLGAPVVTSDDPALVEVGSGAPLVAPVGDEHALAEQLIEVVAPGRRKGLTDAGRLRAADFSAERTGELLWDVYAQVAGEAHRGGSRGRPQSTGR